MYSPTRIGMVAARVVRAPSPFFFLCVPVLATVLRSCCVVMCVRVVVADKFCSLTHLP
jgi:hypothetical protein